MNPRFGALIATLVLMSTATASADVTGELRQLDGVAGCYSFAGSSDAGAGTCTDIRNGDGVSELAISPDGGSAYAIQYNGNRGMIVFDRDPATGALEQLAGPDGCLSSDGSGEGGAGSCTDVRALEFGGDGRAIAISPDGQFVYVASQGKDAVLVFARDVETSRLTQLTGTGGCISRSGDGAPSDPPATCTDGLILDAPAAAVLTPDAKHLLVLSFGNDADEGLMIFRRDATTGRLTQLPGPAGCMSGTGAGEGVAGACADLDSYVNGLGLVASPDGRNVYLTSSGRAGVLTLSRDATTGALTQLPGRQGCMTADGAGDGGADTCGDGRALRNAYQALISPDGRHLYVVSSSAPGAVTVFARDPDTGVLTQLPGADGCISGEGSSEDGPDTCVDGRALGGGYAAPAISSDGRSVYVASSFADSVAVFDRDPASGRLTQLPGVAGCASTTGAGASGDPAATCANARGLDEAYSVALSPDDRFVYVPALTSDAISVFSRRTQPTCSDSTVTVAHGGTVTVPLPCSELDGDAFTRSVVTGPAGGTVGTIDQENGTVTYTAREGFTGTDTFTFRASDATSAGPVATATIEVAAPVATTDGKQEQQQQQQQPAPQPEPQPQPQLQTQPQLPVALPRDTTAPRCDGLPSRIRARDLLRGRLRLSVRCAEAARIGGRLHMPRSRARKLRLVTTAGGTRPLELARGAGRVAAGGPATLTIRPSSAMRKRLSRVSGRGLSTTRLTLTLVAVDAAGNRSTTERVVRLR